MSDELAIKDLVRSPPTDLLAWSVMHLLSTYGSGDFLKHFGIDASNHDNTVKVELRINGIEVSPREVFAELDRQHTDMVKREAMELLQQKCDVGNITRMLDSVEFLVRRESAEALGVDWEDR